MAKKKPEFPDHPMIGKHRQSKNVIDIRNFKTDKKQNGEAHKLSMMTDYLLTARDGGTSPLTSKEPLKNQANDETEENNRQMNFYRTQPESSMVMNQAAKNRKLINYTAQVTPGKFEYSDNLKKKKK